MKRVICGFVLLFLVGCGAEKVPLTGVVTLDGQPLADVEVQFIPEPDGQSDAPTVSVYTDKTGRYEVSTRDSVSLQPAKYRVCINDATLMMPRGNADPASGEPGRQTVAETKRSRVPVAYSDVTKTPFRDILISTAQPNHDFSLVSRP
ncbi:MAG: hypothetical protein ACRC8S_18285 [Fimbriiglobus sp.]